MALCLPLNLWAFDACKTAAQTDYVSIAQSQPKARTLFFRIEHCGASPSYIFGTMHTDDPTIQQKAAPVISRLPQIRTAAFEYLEPKDGAMVMQKAMFDPLGVKPLSQQLTAQEWDNLKKELVQKRGLPEMALARLRPWAASVMLQMPQLKHGGVILDDMIKSSAKARGLPLIGLETMQEQMNIFDGMTQEQQLTMLKETISSLPELNKMNDELETAYNQRDLAHIERLGAAGFADISDAGLRQYLENALLIVRNQRMVERAEPELNKGSLLIAVGALHLPGTDGILQRLERAGYYVFPVQ